MRHVTLLLLFALSQATFAATVGTSVRVIASAGGPEEAPDDTDFNQNFDPSSASAAAISPHAGASADAFADFGVIKAMAQQNSSGGGFVGAGFAEGKWTEIMTLSSGSFNGQKAHITIGITLQGFISSTGTGRGAVNLDFNIGLGNGLTINGAWDSDTPDNATGFPLSGLNISGSSLFYSNIHDVTAEITLGNSFVVSEVLVASASKNGCQTTAACLLSGSGTVDVDFGHTSYWDGIKSISVLNTTTGLFESKDVSFFSLVGNSGVDYSQSFVPAAVPVPAAIWLFAPGLGCLAAAQRRRVDRRRG